MRERRPTSSRPGGVPRAGPAPGWVAAELRSTARVSARKATDLALNPLSLVHELDDEDHRRRRARPGRKPRQRVNGRRSLRTTLRYPQHHAQRTKSPPPFVVGPFTRNRTRAAQGPVDSFQLRPTRALPKPGTLRPPAPPRPPARSAGAAPRWRCARSG